jgi:4-amino-4-deoxy-L-arabinose transferase-like glycosyltransferase
LPLPRFPSRARSLAIPFLALAAVLLLAGALRIHHLDRESFWLDESFSALIAPTSLTHIVHETMDDVHPPLYYVALHYWVRLAGDTETGTRLLSVMFSLALILAAFLLASRLAGRRPAFLAALVLTWSPFQIEYAQEARMYALLALLATLSMLAFTALLTRWRAGWFALLVASTTLMLYTQIHSVFVVAGQALALAVLAALDWRAFRRALGPWLMAELLALAFFAPWIGPLASQIARVGGAFWIPPPSWSDVVAVFGAYAGSVWLGWGLGAFAIVGVIAAARFRSPATHPRAAVILACWLVACTIGPFLASQMGTPIFLPKYTIAASVPFAILAGMGIARLPWEWLRASMVGLLIAATLGPLSHYDATPEKDDWRGATALIERLARPGDVVLFYPGFNRLPFWYYRTRADLVDEPLPIYPGLVSPALTPAIVKGTVRHHDRLWLVMLHAEPQRAAILREAERWRTRTGSYETPHVDIYLLQTLP